MFSEWVKLYIILKLWVREKQWCNFHSHSLFCLPDIQLWSSSWTFSLWQLICVISVPTLSGSCRCVVMCSEIVNWSQQLMSNMTALWILHTGILCLLFLHTVANISTKYTSNNTSKYESWMCNPNYLQYLPPKSTEKKSLKEIGEKEAEKSLFDNN